MLQERGRRRDAAVDVADDPLVDRPRQHQARGRSHRMADSRRPTSPFSGSDRRTAGFRLQRNLGYRPSSPSALAGTGPASVIVTRSRSSEALSAAYSSAFQVAAADGDLRRADAVHDGHDLEHLDRGGHHMAQRPGRAANGLRPGVDPVVADADLHRRRGIGQILDRRSRQPPAAWPGSCAGSARHRPGSPSRRHRHRDPRPATGAP